MFPGKRAFLGFLGAFCALTLAHLPWLQLPFYWDELGQFVPAALDIFHSLAWVPYTTVPNVHPPLVMAYLAAIWKLTGYSVVHTRLAMLLLSAGSLAATWCLAFTLSRRRAVAWLSTALLFACPLFFAQASLAQLDMPAMFGTTLALSLFLEEQWLWCALICCAAVLAKETAIAAPAIFGLTLLLRRRLSLAMLFLFPLVPLAIWLFVLKQNTGHLLGSPEFAQYNLFYPIHPVRLALALLRRVYYLLVGSGHIFGTVAILMASRFLFSFRWKLVLSFAALHVLLISVLGGAVLERYLLPVLPILYCAFSTAALQLRPWLRLLLIPALVVSLAAACWLNPLYPFPMENNLAWTTFVSLHQQAAGFAQQHLQGKMIATSFPLAGALRRPELGYVTVPSKILEINDFSEANLAGPVQSHADALIAYSVIWDPLNLLSRKWISTLLTDYYGYIPQSRPQDIPRLTGMVPVFQSCLYGQCVEAFERPPVKHP